jgi:hypothetical protein
MFGADGWAPTLQRQGDDENAAVVKAPSYSQTAKAEHVAALRSLMNDVLRLLGRCGVHTEGAKVYEYPTRRSASTYAAARDGEPRTVGSLNLTDGCRSSSRWAIGTARTRCCEPRPPPSTGAPWIASTNSVSGCRSE